MNEFFKKLTFLCQKKEEQSQKIKVCWDFLAKILGDLLLLSREEENELSQLDQHDPGVLREIIQEFVVPLYHYYPPENQEKIKNTLTYYLTTDSEKLEWPFASYYVPLDDDIAKLFYTLVWEELYGTDGPDQINPDDYEEDCSVEYIDSLYGLETLKKKYNPSGKEPSIANVIARLKRTS